MDGDVLSVTQVVGSQLGQCYAPVDIGSDDDVRFMFDMNCGDGHTYGCLIVVVGHCGSV